MDENNGNHDLAAKFVVWVVFGSVALVVLALAVRLAKAILSL